MVTQTHPIPNAVPHDGQIRRPAELPAPAPGSVDHAASVDQDGVRPPHKSRKRWVVLAAV